MKKNIINSNNKAREFVKNFNSNFFVRENEHLYCNDKNCKGHDQKIISEYIKVHLIDLYKELENKKNITCDNYIKNLGEIHDIDDNCAICKEKMDCGGNIKLGCNHCYHKDCILPWLKISNYCPLCRYRLPNNYVNINEENIVINILLPYLDTNCKFPITVKMVKKNNRFVPNVGINIKKNKPINFI